MWFIIGIGVGVAVLALVLWLRSRNVKVTWYEWLIGTIGLALLLYTVQNVVGFITEIEPSATWLFALVGGLFLLSGLKLLHAIRSEKQLQQIAWALTLGFSGGFGSLVRPYGLIIFLSIWVIIVVSLRHKLLAASVPAIVALVRKLSRCGYRPDPCGS